MKVNIRSVARLSGTSWEREINEREDAKIVIAKYFGLMSCFLINFTNDSQKRIHTIHDCLFRIASINLGFIYEVLAEHTQLPDLYLNEFAVIPQSLDFVRMDPGHLHCGWLFSDRNCAGIITSGYYLTAPEVILQGLVFIRMGQVHLH